MLGGDSTGPAGQGPGIGRSNENREQCRDRSTKSLGGTGGLCVCPQCGLETPTSPESRAAGWGVGVAEAQ